LVAGVNNMLRGMCVMFELLSLTSRCRLRGPSSSGRRALRGDGCNAMKR